MKIINIDTNVIFDLPQKDAEHLLSSAPNIFFKVTKNNKVVKNKNKEKNDSVLSKILDD